MLIFIKKDEKNHPLEDLSIITLKVDAYIFGCSIDSQEIWLIHENHKFICLHGVDVCFILNFKLNVEFIFKDFNSPLVIHKNHPVNHWIKWEGNKVFGKEEFPGVMLECI